MNEQTTENRFKRESGKSTARLARWTAGWLVTCAVMTFGPLLLWTGNTVLTIATIIVNLAVGGGMIVANIKHMETLDELQRKMHLEAMSFTLGVVLVGGIAYSTLDIADVISFDAEISHVVVLMGLTYMATLLRLHRNYQ